MKNRPELIRPTSVVKSSLSVNEKHVTVQTLVQHPYRMLIGLLKSVLNKGAVIHTFAVANDYHLSDTENVSTAFKHMEALLLDIDNCLEPVVRPYGEHMQEMVSTVSQMTQRDGKEILKGQQHLKCVYSFFDRYPGDSMVRYIFDLYLHISNAKIQFKKMKDTYKSLIKFKKSKKSEKIVKPLLEQLKRNVDLFAGFLGYRAIPWLETGDTPHFAREIQLTMATQAYQQGISLNHAVETTPAVTLISCDDQGNTKINFSKTI